MGYYDRNRSLSLEVAKEDYGSNNAPKISESRSTTIDKILTERRAKGEYLPEAGSSIEYRVNNLKAIGRVLGYDLHPKGELVILCEPSTSEQRRGGQALIIRRAKDIFKTNEVASEIIYR